MEGRLMYYGMALLLSSFMFTGSFQAVVAKTPAFQVVNSPVNPVFFTSPTGLSIRLAPVPFAGHILDKGSPGQPQRIVGAPIFNQKLKPNQVPKVFVVKGGQPVIITPTGAHGLRGGGAK